MVLLVRHVLKEEAEGAAPKPEETSGNLAQNMSIKDDPQEFLSHLNCSLEAPPDSRVTGHTGKIYTTIIFLMSKII